MSPCSSAWSHKHLTAARPSPCIDGPGRYTTHKQLCKRLRYLARYPNKVRSQQPTYAATHARWQLSEACVCMAVMWALVYTWQVRAWRVQQHKLRTPQSTSAARVPGVRLGAVDAATTSAILTQRPCNSDTSLTQSQTGGASQGSGRAASRASSASHPKPRTAGCGSGDAATSSSAAGDAPPSSAHVRDSGAGDGDCTLRAGQHATGGVAPVAQLSGADGLAVRMRSLLAWEPLRPVFDALLQL